MLANGITLSYGETKDSYTKLVGLKEVPEFGIELEKVENTTLEDTVKKYEFGIGDIGELEYKFSYNNSSATAPYRVLRKAADDKKKLYFEQAYPDGTKVILKAKYLLSLAVAVSMPLSISHLRLPCSLILHLLMVLEVN